MARRLELSMRHDDDDDDDGGVYRLESAAPGLNIAEIVLDSMCGG